jgi:hypothetical protein
MPVRVELLGKTFSFFGFFDEVNQSRYLVRRLLVTEAVPLLLGEFFSQMGLYGKIDMPADDHTGAGEITCFLSAIAKGNLPSQFWTSDLKIMERCLRIGHLSVTLRPVSLRCEKPRPVGVVMFVGFAILLSCGINVGESTAVLCVRFYVLRIDAVNICFPKA